jgi:hypothetical protein
VLREQPGEPRRERGGEPAPGRHPVRDADRRVRQRQHHDAARGGLLARHAAVEQRDPVTVLDEPLGQLYRGHPHPAAPPDAEQRELAPQGVLADGADQRAAGDLRPADVPPGEVVRRRDAQAELVVEQVRRGDMGRRQVPGDRHLEVAGVEHRPHVRPGRRLDPQVGVRHLAQQRADDRRQHVVAHRRGRHDPQPSAGPRPYLGGELVDLAQLGQRLLRGDRDPRPVGGQPQPPPPLLGEREPRPALRRAQRLADRRVGEQQLLGDLRDGLAVQHPDEDAELGRGEHIAKDKEHFPAEPVLGPPARRA